MFKAKKMKSNKAGFTLIEVVLVLAIGGLIFLLAFLAFGQATKNRRDTQRRSDAARVLSEIENQKGDGNGTAFTDATSMGTFITSYLGGTSATSFTSNNIVYTVNYGTSMTSPSATSSTATMAMSNSAKCQGNGATSTGASSGDYAVVVKLEKGQACRDNQ